MSDEPSSSAAPAYDPNDREDGATTAPADLIPSAAQVAKARKNNRLVFNKKRRDLLLDLCNTLDMYVYAELSTIYYMDCSFLRFLLRALVQFILLSPKPAIFPEPPQNRPYVGGILVSSLICIFFHIWNAAPSAGEATRGYLHGGLAMDFIGQRGPSSKVHLVLLDLLVILLQLTHMAAHVTAKRLKETRASATAVSQPRAEASRQDIDSEERGVRRSTEQNDIEMQNLNPSGQATTASSTRDDDVEEPTREDSTLDSTAPPRDAQIFDAFNSGQIVIGDLNLWKITKDEFWAYQKAPPETTTSGQVLRASLLGRMLRLGGGS
ncbi:hypothetical protein MBLNU230_g4388t1 [Neophaeotheca triangularis]